MIVAVASGKGGTGKTTVAVNLAQAVSSLRPERGIEQVLLLDCDVEEPNAALFLHPDFDASTDVTVMVPAVDAKLCSSCGRCAEVCQYHALAVVEPKVLVFPTLCHGCGSCTLICPETAISEHWRVMGVIEQGRTPGGIRFAQGVLNIGEAMSSPVIRKLKELTIPEDTRSSLVLLDVPPGSACSMVEAVRGADVVLMVSEPTPFGLHDLRLAVQVVREEMGLPVGVVINRDGVGYDELETYCSQESLPIWMRLPFDRRVAEAYAEGGLIIEALPEYRTNFVDLYGRLMQQEVR